MSTSPFAERAALTKAFTNSWPRRDALVWRPVSSQDHANVAGPTFTGSVSDRASYFPGTNGRRHGHRACDRRGKRRRARCLAGGHARRRPGESPGGAVSRGHQEQADQSELPRAQNACSQHERENAWREKLKPYYVELGV